MATTIKTFHFISDTEGWQPVGNSNYLVMDWYPPHRGFGRNSRHQRTRSEGFLATVGGCLKTTNSYNQPSAETYWQWVGSFEDLGVPSGQTVKSIKGEYLYRWFLKTRGKKENTTFGNNEAGTGPFEIRDNNDNLIGVFSDRIYSIARTEDNLWKAYPQDPNYPHDPPHRTAYPLSDTPPSWGLAEGQTINLNLPSNTVIKLRLKVLSPATGPNRRQRVRLKQDRIRLTINHEETTGRRRNFPFIGI